MTPFYANFYGVHSHTGTKLYNFQKMDLSSWGLVFKNLLGTALLHVKPELGEGDPFFAMLNFAFLIRSLKIKK